MSILYSFKQPNGKSRNPFFDQANRIHLNTQKTAPSVWEVHFYSKTVFFSQFKTTITQNSIPQNGKYVHFRHKLPYRADLLDDRFLGA